MIQKIQIEGGYWNFHSPFTGHLINPCNQVENEIRATPETDPEFLFYDDPYESDNFIHPDLPVLLAECGIIPPNTGEEEVEETLSNIAGLEDKFPLLGFFVVEVKTAFPDLMSGEGWMRFAFAPSRVMETKHNELPRFTATSVPVCSIGYEGPIHSFYSGLPVDLHTPDCSDETLLFVYHENSAQPWKYAAPRVLEKCINRSLPALPEVLVSLLDIGFEGLSYAVAFRVSSSSDGVAWYGFAPRQDSLDEFL